MVLLGICHAKAPGVFLVFFPLPFDSMIFKNENPQLKALFLDHSFLGFVLLKHHFCILTFNSDVQY